MFEVITITDNTDAANWVLTSATDLLGPDGVALVTPSSSPTAVLQEDGTYDYIFTGYVATDGVTTYTATFTNMDGETLSITGGICPPPLDEVPTVGEWGLMMLGLLLTITAIVGIRQRREEETYA